MTLTYYFKQAWEGAYIVIYFRKLPYNTYRIQHLNRLYSFDFSLIQTCLGQLLLLAGLQRLSYSRSPYVFFPEPNSCPNGVCVLQLSESSLHKVGSSTGSICGHRNEESQLKEGRIWLKSHKWQKAEKKTAAL